MAIQSIPLANSLYLAMLQQERQDIERDSLRSEQAEERRNANMHAVQNYVLKKQSQDQLHEREMEKLKIQKRAQLVEEKMQQRGLMNRRMMQDVAAGGRTAATQEGRRLDRAQRLTLGTEANRLREQRLRLGQSQATERRTQRETMDRQKIAIRSADTRVRQAQAMVESIRKEIEDAGTIGLTTDMQKRKVAADAALSAAAIAFQKIQQAYVGQYTPQLLDPLGTPTGTEFTRDGGGGLLSLEERYRQWQAGQGGGSP